MALRFNRAPNKDNKFTSKHVHVSEKLSQVFTNVKVGVVNKDVCMYICMNVMQCNAM